MEKDGEVGDGWIGVGGLALRRWWIHIVGEGVLGGNVPIYNGQ